MTSTSSAKEPPNDEISNADANSSNHSHDDDDDLYTFRSRKSYPQRNNRPKLNYRDLERGMYDKSELRQSLWAMGGPAEFKRNQSSTKDQRRSNYSDDEDQTIDMAANDVNEDSNDESMMTNESSTNDQMHRRLWCICKKPWDHSRLMLRCDSCSDWYHGDCIGMTREQAQMLEIKGDRFICPLCQGPSRSSASKPTKSSGQSIVIKRKLPESAPAASEIKSKEKSESVSSNKTVAQPELVKRPKTGIFFHRDSPNERQVHCIVQSCTNWAKSGWVYCSAPCIRRHINDTLQAIQRSKGTDNDNPPAREDILLYESRTKRILDKTLVPKVEDLCNWLNQHPSYEIVKPALRQSILLTANQSKTPLTPGINRSSPVNSNIPTPKSPSTPTPNKPKLSWVPVGPSTKPVPIKKAPVTLSKPASQPTTAPSSNVPNTADIRSKVPNALYEKLLMRISKSGEQNISNEEIRSITEKIEEEMFRVYGKVDNSYKNKFRSLLANISNMTNNFFYKHILSKEVTAKQIVAMKPEDMLPPEEKEKRKDEFEKEVQMIIKAEEQSAEEMARRARIKVTRQGLVENDAVIPIFKKEEPKIVETSSTSTSSTKSIEPKKEVIDQKPKLVKKSGNSTTSKPVTTKKPISSSTVVKPKPKPKLPETDSVKNPTENLIPPLVKLDSSPPILVESPIVPPATEKPIEIPKAAEESERKMFATSPSESHLIYTPGDLDNDYIEPESPTGIDALLYDDDEDLNNTSIHSRTSNIPQTTQPESINTSPVTGTNRDDYNPLMASKSKIESSSEYQPTPISRITNFNSRWRGTVLLPDFKLNCQCLKIFGDGDYLIADIPEQLGILGRLRIGDLWDYVRESLPVRDVIVLNLISSDNAENPNFLRYLETMRQSGRAAVMTKRSEPSTIRDMYILPAETKDCPAAVISSLTLNSSIEPNQMFLVVIGSGKRTSKTANRPAESTTNSNLTYKPVAIQEPALMRDPRLSRNKDPRLTTSQLTNETKSTEIASPIIASNSILVQTDLDKCLAMMSDSLERIRQTSSIDAVTTIMLSTIEFLKSHGHEDLCSRFTDEIPSAISKWQTSKEIESKTIQAANDNLNEENMEVDDESDKKQFVESEFNDVDYRFLDQDRDHRMMMSIHGQDVADAKPSNDSSMTPLDADHRIIASNSRRLNN